MMRLMEVLLHRGPQLDGWRTAQIHEAILVAFSISAEAYSLNLRYDLRKMKAHGLLERQGQRYCYRLTTRGRKWPPCSFSSIGGCAAHWPTRYFIAGQKKHRTRPPRSKAPITKPMPPFRSSSICLPRRQIRETNSQIDQARIMTQMQHLSRIEISKHGVISNAVYLA